MQSTAAISTRNTPAQPTKGRSGPESAQGQDFISALSRLAYGSLAGGAATAQASLYDPDNNRPADDPAPDARRTDSAPSRAPKSKDDTDLAEPQRAGDDTPRKDATALIQPEQPKSEHRESTTPDDPAKTTESGTAAAAPPPADAPRSNGSPAPLAPQHGTTGAAVNPAQAQRVPPAGGETPPPAQPAPQAASRGSDATQTQTQITAQVVDGADGDRLPQISHTLSSRSALVAQSDGSRTAPSGDAAAKATPADGTAASLVAGTAQTGAQAVKGKGQNKQGGNKAAGNAANANGTQNAAAQAGQAAAGGAQATPLPLQQQQQQQLQQRLAATAAGSRDGLGTGASQAGTSRTEPFTLAGAGHAGAQPGTHNGAAAAQAPKAPPPVPARFIANQVAVQIQKAFGEGGDRISIQLRPADLGRVEVRLDVGHHGHVSAVITADRADTLDLLQRDARLLQHALQDAGLQADSNSLTFELKNQEQAFTPSSDGAAGGGGAGEGDNDPFGVAEAAALHARQNVIADGRVDIRV